MQTKYMHLFPHLILVLILATLPASSANPLSQSNLINSSECVLTRQLLTSNVLIPLNHKLNSDMSLTFFYEMNRSLGLYSHCYNLQIEFIMKETKFKATNVIRSDTNEDLTSQNLNYPLAEQYFSFSVTVPEDSITSSCPPFSDRFPEYIFYCKIRISLIEVSSLQSVGYFENKQLVLALLPSSDLYEQYFPYFQSLPNYYHKMEYTPEIINNSVGLKKFTTLNDSNQSKNSDKRNQQDLSGGSSLDGDNAIQVKERIVNQDADEQIGYALYTLSDSGSNNKGNQSNQNKSYQDSNNNSLVEDAKMYKQKDIQFQDFNATSILELILLNYPSNLIFSMKLGSTYCQFVSDSQKDKKFSYYYSNSSDCNVSAQSKESSNGKYGIYFDHPVGQDNFTVIQEIVFYTAQRNINKVFVSQFFQLQRTKDTLQITFLQTNLVMNLLQNSNFLQINKEKNDFLSYLSLQDNLLLIAVAGGLVLLAGCFVLVFIYKRRKSQLNSSNNQCPPAANGKLLEANVQDLEA